MCIPVNAHSINYCKYIIADAVIDTNPAIVLYTIMIVQLLANTIFIIINILLHALIHNDVELGWK